MTSPGSTDRTRVRRIPDKAVTDLAVLHAVLDAGLVAHVSVIDDGMPFVLPVAFARRGDEVLFHGSTGSRLFRLLAAGQPTCLTVTLLDGLVLARSAFESSMNYRSAMVLGVPRWARPWHNSPPPPPQCARWRPRNREHCRFRKWQSQLPR